MIYGLTITCVFLSFWGSGAPSAGHEDADSVQIIWVDLGQNLTIPCGSVSSRGIGQSVIWVHEGRGSLTNHVQKDGSIFFHQLQLSDSGIYSCSLEDPDDDSSSSSSSLYKSSSETNFHQSMNWPSYETRFHIRVRSKCSNYYTFFIRVIDPIPCNLSI